MWNEKEPLDVRDILDWADAHYERTGRYPDVTSGRVIDAPCEKWINIDQNLRRGNRGLPAGWSLAQLMDELRGKRNVKNLPRHTVKQILKWADAHFARTGQWPTGQCGSILDAPDESWQVVDLALRAGVRGLRGGSSLSRLLCKKRGVRRRRNPDEGMAEPLAPLHGKKKKSRAYSKAMWRRIKRLRAGRNHMRLPPYTIEQILAWADAHFARHGVWPSGEDGLIEGTRGETWGAVDEALFVAVRGLPGDSSLADVLAQYRGVRNVQRPPQLSIEQILVWADEHHRRTGNWPTVNSGHIEGTESSEGDTWAALDHALRRGRRGLTGGSSLADLLDKHRGTQRAKNTLPLRIRTILEWADAYYRRCGKWPITSSGPIPESSGDTWEAVELCLRYGYRRLPGGMSLAKLLAEQRGMRNRMALPPLRVDEIIAWANAHYARYGKWPTQSSGPVAAMPGETWGGINQSLRDGRRGLPGGSSLPLLLAERCGKRNPSALPLLTEEQVLAWADSYYARNGGWPRATMGRIDESPADTWQAIDRCLSKGRRGLPGGSSLALLLAAHRGVRRTQNRVLFTVREILEWADAWHQRHGNCLAIG